MSLHIADLEARIGAPLLSRKRGQVHPTAIGETLIDRARRLLEDAAQALDDVQRQVKGLAGRVRLGASTGALAYLLPQALDVLGKRHPGIDVEVAVLTSQQSLARLVDGSLDIGLVALPRHPNPAWKSARGAATRSWPFCPQAGKRPRRSHQAGWAPAR